MRASGPGRAKARPEPAVLCFAEGTRILTECGEQPIESLQPGLRIAVLDPRAGASAAPAMQPLLWVGRRRIRPGATQVPGHVAPVHILPGALGPGQPSRELVLSPEHRLLLAGMLVQVRQLVNGVTITQDMDCPEVTYFHLELPSHAVVLAEGAPAESWLDRGNRHWFENAPVALLRPRAGLEAAPPRLGPLPEPCAPLLTRGPALSALRRQLTAIARRSQPPSRLLPGLPDRRTQQ
jgi:hypothetical protein